MGTWLKRLTITHPLISAHSAMAVRSTVLPVPQAPTKIVALLGSPGAFVPHGWEVGKISMKQQTVRFKRLAE